MIVAALTGHEIEEVTITVAAFHATFDEAKLFKMTLPTLAIEAGEQTNLISGSLAIVRYLAHEHESLLGKTPFERAQVDMWLQFLRSELQPLQRAVVYQALGHVKCDTPEHTYVYGLLKEALKTPNNYLKGKSYFVGGTLTVVDVFFTLI